ncbi:parallel beta-helix domain-containing protein [Thalassoglobus polymorphus]|uniref:Right handed beta helix domain-containing protein n=1 Tax=Thalassoglobus polymorphus TaxID=2527994 RepID=A0A517QTH2_9PLAN|nr:parallel beta-helix domain-containing protein [Thalassoglobus polymorphus]QDT34946.1 hypothetical protein Mal48_42190 [Thalassoglobus polymorphus]
MRSNQVSLRAQSLTTFVTIVSLAGVWLLVSESGTFAQPEAAQLEDAKPEDAKPVQPLAPSTCTISPGETAQFDLQNCLINAVPGDVIQLEAGTYQINSQLDVACDNLTLRGRGIDKTILSFQGQEVGSEGLVATGDAFVIEDLAVENTVGNAIKVLGANGVIFRGVRTEWTNGPSANNGAYGIYPVQCRNVLIEDCVAIAASDAGVYVGQSEDVVVRRCRAEMNVAGIEIENTLRADVYENIATNNTGGILVFDLPGLQLTNGGHVRVFKNKIYKNNTPNFAPPGNMVATVPTGTGLMIMATDHVEVFDNEISDNQTTGISIFSFHITQRPIKDAKYDPYPEGISIHHNKIVNGGEKPSGVFGELLSTVVGVPFPQVFYDGIINETKLGEDGKLPANLALKLADNGEVTFANANVAKLSLRDVLSGKYEVDRDIAAYTGMHPAIPKVTLQPLSAPSPNGNPAVSVYRNAPEKLSEWGLFKGDGRSQEPVDGVILYDLNTPLFTDDTEKYRFIRLPEGESMRYQPDSVFEFPVGTVIAKTFAYQHDLRDPESEQSLLETRIEVHEDSGWYGFTYIWDDEQADAFLALGGGSRDVSWIQADGTKVSNRYQIPNANQCITCHSRKGKFVPLGPTARNMNRSFHGLRHGANQLAHWKQSGQLSNAPELEQIARLPVYDDPSTGSLNDRARAWLDVNCAHCHHPTGTARTSGLDLSLSQNDPAKFGVWKSPTATGRGSGGRMYDIVPGKPDKSILVYRMESDEPGVRMPNLGRNISHPESIELIREWIQSMPLETPKPGE